MKNTFIGVLCARFTVDEKEEIRLSESVLRENDLGDNTFWEVLCPLLEKEGILKYYNDPDSPLSDLGGFVCDDDEYKVVSRDFGILSEIATGGIPKFNGQHYFPECYSSGTYAGKNGEEMAKNALLKMREIEERLRKNFRHKFIVNKEKLFNKKPLSFNKERGIVHFEGKDITVSKTKNSDTHHLTLVVFSNKEKTWANGRTRNC